MLTTTVVGSYPQPHWLVDHDRLRTNAVPRVRMPEMWRVAAPFLQAAQDDAVRLAVADMEAADVDIVTDGEQRRESYFNQFATALDGVDPITPGTAINRVGKPQAVPRIVGPIARARSVLVDDARFLRGITRRRIKVTIPGPFTMTQLAQDEHYRDPERLAMAYAEAVNAELAELEPLVDVLQLDEPYMQAQPDRARAYAVPAINRALRGLRNTTVVHLCFGYAFSVKDKPSGYSFLPELDRCVADQISIEAAQPGLDLSVLAALPSKTMVLGVLDLGSPHAESADTVARRIDAALEHLPASRLVLAPDCGMKHLPRALARAKLGAMVAGARLVAGARSGGRPRDPSRTHSADRG